MKDLKKLFSLIQEKDVVCSIIWLIAVYSFLWQQYLSHQLPLLAWYFHDSNTYQINFRHWPGISMTAIHITSIATIGLLFLWQQYLSHQLQLLAGISITAIHITSIATIDLVFWVHLNVKMFIIGLWQVGFLAG